MSAEVISFRPSEDELQAAWDAYDRAHRHFLSLYEHVNSTSSRERMDAALEANKLFREFRRLCDRMPTK